MTNIVQIIDINTDLLLFVWIFFFFKHTFTNPQNQNKHTGYIFRKPLSLFLPCVMVINHFPFHEYYMDAIVYYITISNFVQDDKIKFNQIPGIPKQDQCTHQNILFFQLSKIFWITFNLATVQTFNNINQICLASYNHYPDCSWAAIIERY